MAHLSPFHVEISKRGSVMVEDNETVAEAVDRALQLEADAALYMDLTYNIVDEDGELWSVEDAEEFRKTDEV